VHITDQEVLDWAVTKLQEMGYTHLWGMAIDARIDWEVTSVLILQRYRGDLGYTDTATLIREGVISAVRTAEPKTPGLSLVDVPPIESMQGPIRSTIEKISKWPYELPVPN
jgi:hypothetical protein